MFPGDVIDVVDGFSAEDGPTSPMAIFHLAAVVGDVIECSVGITCISSAEGVSD